MRLLISVHIGGSSRSEIMEIFRELGWLPPEDSTLGRVKLKAMIKQLPMDARMQVDAGMPFAFKAGVVTPWGIASMELDKVLRMRIIGDSIESLRQEADDIVRKFARTYRERRGEECAFERNVTIRRLEDEAELVAGTIENVDTLSFRRYRKTYGGQEEVLLRAFTAIVLLSVIASAAIFHYAEHGDPTKTNEYWRGYLDRAITAFLAAAVTLFFTLFHRWQNWKGSRYRIRWGDRGYQQLNSDDR